MDMIRFSSFDEYQYTVFVKDLRECFTLSNEREENKKGISQILLYTFISLSNRLMSLVGLLTWHLLELIYAKGKRHITILSNITQARFIVYESIGTFTLSLLLSTLLIKEDNRIHLFTLPIITGTVYGFINNQFTVRECPEYYTLGHTYDKENLRYHAIKTHSPLIKSFVTGCYGSVAVTKLIGICLFFCVPFQPRRPQPPFLLIVTFVLSSLLTGHIYSIRQKRLIQSYLDKYVQEANIKSWNELLLSRPLHHSHIKEVNPQLDAIYRDIHEHVHEEDNVPVLVLPRWVANTSRNFIAYSSSVVGFLLYICWLSAH